MTTIMFWNLYEAAHDLRNGDATQWERQVSLVRRHRPDILATTEGWNWHLDGEALFRRALTDFGYAHGELYQAKTNCDMAVMWNDPISCRSVDRVPREVAMWHGHMRVTLDVPGQPEPFAVVVSHLNPFDPTLRTIEGSHLRNRMVHTPHGVLVMDANTVAPGDPEPMARPNRNQVGESVCDRRALIGLADIGLVDVGARAGNRSPTVGFYGGVEFDPVRIDQAWATPSVRLAGYEVITDDPDADAASDHRAIRFTIA